MLDLAIGHEHDIKVGNQKYKVILSNGHWALILSVMSRIKTSDSGTKCD